MLLILAIALAYAASGRLGLLLAIPPGFATALFPPAGLALACLIQFGGRALPGIWLGSLLMNLSVSWPTSGQPGTGDVALAAGIALGSTLQAITGRWLLQHWVGLPVQWDDERSLVRFALVSATSTTVAASIAIATLWSAGRISGHDAGYSWLTWWVGDSIGVLLITPLLLLLLAPDRATARAQLRAIGVPIVFTFVLVTMVFVRASDWENQQLQVGFSNRAGQIERSVQRHFEQQRDQLQMLERFFAASTQVTATEFSEFTRDLASGKSGNVSFSWVVRLTPDQLAGFQQQQRANGVTDYSVWQWRQDGQQEPVTARSSYFPIGYIEPVGSHWLRGYDNGSEPERHALFQLALARQLPTVSARLWLKQLGHNEPAVLLALPIQRPKRDELVVAGIQIGPAIARALGELPHDDIAIRLSDLDATGTQELFSSHPTNAVINPAFATRTEWPFAGRRWQLELQATPAYLSAQHSWQAWLVLVGGMLFTSLLGAMLMLVHGRAVKVQRLVEQRTSELRQQQQTLQTISDSVADAILLLDEHGCIQIANPATERLLQLNWTALRGRRLDQWLTGWQHNWLQQASQQGPAGVRVETRLQQSNGGSRDVEIALTALATGAEKRYCCLLHDLTDRIAVERIKREFVATVSHELRTPLTSIRGALALLRGIGLQQSPEQAKTLLTMADENSKRLLTLVNDLLDFEKLEMGKLEVKLQTVTLPALLTSCINEMAGFALSQDIRLQWQSRLPETYRITLDPDRFAQVMNNLLSNAIKFSPRGGTVIIRAEANADRLRIEVCDYGIGIPAAKQANIFQKFWQADASTSRRHSGTGLGLAISKGLVEAMQGRIGFHSQPDVGSTFWLEFPSSNDANELGTVPRDSDPNDNHPRDAGPTPP